MTATLQQVCARAAAGNDVWSAIRRYFVDGKEAA